MSCIHWSNGRKGGVGKSLLSWLLTEYALKHLKAPFCLVETDRVNPDVGRLYKETVRTEFAYFSESEQKRTKADKIFNLACQSTVIVNLIVNLPAQVHEPMKMWFLEDEIYELAKEEGVSFCNWYVSNGGYDSIGLFMKTLKDLGQFMPHVLVRNWGLCDDWTHVDEDDELQALVRQYRVPVIDIPKFPYAERNFIEANQLTLTEALSHPKLSLVSKKRVHKFLRQSFAAIESTGLLVDE
ncbi:mobilization protein [Lusitaniella coriacea LEGE 07157]|uniref:Mobilization protein n=1 Tax=Lusitaniella coriacea LEGE 07157 TaxID=945747 RepID=A0A8J7J3Z1_9CYAN|nr:mobilization protein [Lusitaniella coriacea]MBE9117259.1 mobilization protein [Lusitaniella coriacea LEGE 07157]